MKIVTVVGARPQFIKCACLCRELRKVAAEVLVHTGQHYDDNMSDAFFRELEIPQPDYHLGIGSGLHGNQTGRMLQAIEEVLQKEKPDYVLVYGDTNSTLAGAPAGAKLQVPGAHAEGGLRSFNKKMPEEINRVLTDHMADLLFCPTQTAVQNLEREGIREGVHLVGDVMIDAVFYYGQKAEAGSRVLERCGLKPKAYALATVHRAENTDDPDRFFSIFSALDQIAREGLPVLVPLHPRSRKQMESHHFDSANLQIVEPVSYLDMLQLEKKAKAILTDSGGVQKEACVFQVPCITLREETEWVETVEAGWNVLAGTHSENIVQTFRKIKNGFHLPEGYGAGAGNAAKKIIETLIQQFSLTR